MSKPGYVLLRGLKHARLHTGLTRVEFAHRIQVPTGTLQRWEELRGATPAELVPKLARECGVNVESLLVGKPVGNVPKKNERRGRPKGSTKPDEKDSKCQHCGEELNGYNTGPYCLRHHAAHNRTERDEA